MLFFLRHLLKGSELDPLGCFGLREEASGRLDIYTQGKHGERLLKQRQKLSVACAMPPANGGMQILGRFDFECPHNVVHTVGKGPCHSKHEIKLSSLLGRLSRQKVAGSQSEGGRLAKAPSLLKVE